MSRRPRFPKLPKEPKAPVTYEESSAIREVAERLIRMFPAKFGWTASFKLGYVIVRGSRPRSDGQLDSAARFVKTPPVWHGLTGYDAVVAVHAFFWEGGSGYTALTAEQQEALIGHELCHGEMTDKGTLRVVKHDLTEFRWVVANYGAWQPEIRLFDEQLALFDTHGPGYRTPRTEQATLPDADAPTPIAGRSARNGQPPAPLS